MPVSASTAPVYPIKLLCRAPSFPFVVAELTHTPHHSICLIQSSIMAEVMPGSFIMLRFSRRSLFPFSLVSNFMKPCSPMAFSL